MVRLHFTRQLNQWPLARSLFWSGQWFGFQNIGWRTVCWRVPRKVGVELYKSKAWHPHDVWGTTCQRIPRKVGVELYKKESLTPHDGWCTTCQRVPKNVGVELYKQRARARAIKCSGCPRWRDTGLGGEQTIWEQSKDKHFANPIQ